MSVNRDEGVGYVDPQAESLLLPELEIDTSNHNPTEFRLAEQVYCVERRLFANDEDDGNNAERYLATEPVSGRQVCLSLLHRGIYFPAMISDGVCDWDQSHRFLTEPRRLIELEAYERTVGTHYFPRMLSSIANLSDGRPAFVMEFVPGDSIDHVAPEVARAVADEFRKAMAIGHAAGIAFGDLKIDDLRVLPDCSVRFIDFNTGSFLNPQRAHERINDDKRLLEELLGQVLE